MRFLLFSTLLYTILAIAPQTYSVVGVNPPWTWLSPDSAWAADRKEQFDIDIQELKSHVNRPPAASTPTGSLPNKNSAAKAAKIANPLHSKAKAAESASKVIPQRVKSVKTITLEKKLELLNKLPSPVKMPTPSPATTLVLPRTVPPCEAAAIILDAFSARIPTVEVLTGIPLSAPYAVRLNNIKATVACGLAEAEELTFSRLLAMRDIKMTNITGGDHIESVINKLTDLLELSSQSVRISPYNNRFIYIFPAAGNKLNGIFISLTSESQE